MSTDNPATSPAVFPVVPTSAQAVAHHDAKARGYTQGHSAGYAAGLQLAGLEAAAASARRDAEHADRVAALDARHAAEVAALQQAALALHARTVPVLADAEHALFSCAVDLAEALLGRELADGEASARAALDRASGQGSAEVPASIRMNPADLAALGGNRHGLPETVALVGDPSLNRGDAEADYPHGLLDARLGTAVDRVRVVLLGSALAPNTAPVGA